MTDKKLEAAAQFHAALCDEQIAELKPLVPAKYFDLANRATAMLGDAAIAKYGWDRMARFAMTPECNLVAGEIHTALKAGAAIEAAVAAGLKRLDAIFTGNQGPIQ